MTHKTSPPQGQADIDETREPHFDTEGKLIGYGLPSIEKVLFQAVQDWLDKTSVEDPKLYKKVMSQKDEI